MGNFRGFALAKLIRACGETSPNSIEKPYTYEIEVYDKVSADRKPKIEFVSVGRVQLTYGKQFRMTDGHRFAVLYGFGPWQYIDEQEFEVLKSKWQQVD